MNLPGLRLVVPGTPQDAWWQLRQAITSDEPIIVIEHELLYFDKGDVDLATEPPPIHQASVRRTGTDLTTVSYSRMANLAAAAVVALAEKNNQAEVIDLCSLSPIDWAICVASLQKTRRRRQWRYFSLEHAASWPRRQNG